MNWFTTTHAAGFPNEKKKQHVDEWGGCEHVEQDASLLHLISYENDSFGREGYCMCKECWEAAQKAQAEEMVTCQDCHQIVPTKDTISWRWYDFYAPSGDEPLIICIECKYKPTHLNRVAKDKKERDAELSGSYLFEDEG